VWNVEDGEAVCCKCHFSVLVVPVLFSF
jgi:hypothetical protein